MNSPHSIKVCAHRGASALYPENTLAAFDQAVFFGADMIEFDVRRTSNGQFVIMHDASVDRTTNGSGEIAQLTLDEIRHLDAGQGQQVPTLEEAIVYGHKIALNIHAKEESSADILIRLIRQYHLFHSAFVTSNNIALLHKIRQQEPKIRLCSLVGQNSSDYVDQALSHSECEILQPGHAVASKELVEQAHEHHLKVNVFFADDLSTTQKLVKAGVDGILTNVPDKMIAWLSKM